MNNYIIFGLQSSMAFCIYIIVFKVYLQSRLEKMTFEKAALPFLLLHSFRYLGLMMLVTGQIAPQVPIEALHIMAYGDFAAGVFALIAVIAIVCKSKFAPILILLFSIVGIGDLIIIGPTAFNAGIFENDIGTMWFLLVIYAPTLLLTHIYVLYRLLTRKPVRQ